MDSSVGAAYKETLARVAAAVKESTATDRCLLVGASKTKPVEILLEAYESGLRHFGENYVDEIVTKQPLMPEDVKWHFIGHLQSNKVKMVLVPNLYMIETIDSLKLADIVQKTCVKLNRDLRVLVQVKTSEEISKSGVERGDPIFNLIQHILSKCPNLKFSGLMTLGYEGDEFAFKILREVRKEVSEKFNLKEKELELSMGMSSDFEKAISQGATIARVGTSIFGSRHSTFDTKFLAEQKEYSSGM